MDFSEQPPVSLMPEARLNPRFDRPASDPAEVMPVGSGDLSAMVRFDGADGRLHLHLSKTDWFAKGRDMFGGASVISPGHVAIALPGLDPKSITGFNQQMDLARGAVTIRFATPAGAVAYDVFGLMNSNALVVSLVDSRTNRSGCEAEFVMWRAAMSDRGNERPGACARGAEKWEPGRLVPRPWNWRRDGLCRADRGSCGQNTQDHEPNRTV